MLEGSMKGFCRKVMKVIGIGVKDSGAISSYFRCPNCGLITSPSMSNDHVFGFPEWFVEWLQSVGHHFGGDAALELWQRWFLEGGNPIYAGECGGDLWCFFCGEYQARPDSNEHSEDCIFVAAKRLVEQVACSAAIGRDGGIAERGRYVFLMDIAEA